MGTKVIRGRKKGSQETSYFLSHGDAVIMGSGNSKKTLTTKLGEVDGRIDTINGKIPAEASSGNPLADKDYVTTQVGNKTVDTAHIDNGAVTTVKIADGNVTKVKLAQDVLNFLEEYLADFKGTVETTAALKALTGNKNDWAVYKHTDSNNNVIYSRYRYDESYNDATTGKWKFELDINSSAFTAAQWAAINSGITSEGVAFTKQYSATLKEDVTISTNTVRAEFIDTSGSEPAEYSAELSAEYGLTLQTYAGPSKGSIVGELTATKINQIDNVLENFDGKADKVSGATNGNFAALDANGNLVDANCKPSDYQSKLSTAQMNAVNSGVTFTWKLNVENGLSSHSESIDGIHDALARKIDGLQIITAGRDGTPYGVLPEDISLKQFYADSGSKQCPLQVRYVTVNSTGYIVFVGRVHNNIGYIIFAASDNSFVGLGTIAAPTAAHKAILYAAYPEFESSADMGGYEFDEVDMDTLLS